MRTISALVIHCAATPPNMDIGAEEIRRWHTDPRPRGNGWSDIGYHAVIRRDGTLEEGRPDRRKGAHVRPRNADTLGVCLVGGVDDRGRAEANFTPEQFARLERYIAHVRDRYGDVDIVGHRDIDPGKACPSFDVEDWLISRGLLDWAEAA